MRVSSLQLSGLGTGVHGEVSGRREGNSTADFESSAPISESRCRSLEENAAFAGNMSLLSSSEESEVGGFRARTTAVSAGSYRHDTELRILEMVSRYTLHLQH